MKARTALWTLVACVVLTGCRQNGVGRAVIVSSSNDFQPDRSTFKWRVRLEPPLPVSLLGIDNAHLELKPPPGQSAELEISASFSPIKSQPGMVWEDLEARFPSSPQRFGTGESFPSHSSLRMLLLNSWSSGSRSLPGRWTLVMVEGHPAFTLDVGFLGSRK